MRVQRYAPAALPPGKTRHPLYRRLGRSQSRSGRGAENLVPTGVRSPDRPARSESLYRLSYPGPLIMSRNTKLILRQRIHFESVNKILSLTPQSTKYFDEEKIWVYAWQINLTTSTKTCQFYSEIFCNIYIIMNYRKCANRILNGMTIRERPKKQRTEFASLLRDTTFLILFN